MSRFFSIVIPVFNEEKVLAGNISTLVDFIGFNPAFQFEIVIANNGSTDSTLLIAEELSRKYSMVRIINIAESGRGRALKQAWLSKQAISR